MYAAHELEIDELRRKAVALFTDGRYSEADRLLSELADISEQERGQIALRRAQIGMLGDRLDHAAEQLEIARPEYGAHAYFIERQVDLAVRQGNLTSAIRHLHLLGRHARAHQLEGLDGEWYQVLSLSTHAVALDDTHVLPLFEAKLNGEAGRFILDTGTGDCLLDADFASRAGVEPGHFDQVSYAGGRTGHLQLARIETLAIGESRFRRLPAMIAPLGDRFRREFVDAPIDGIVGASLLRAAGGVDIDYRRSRFRLGSPDLRDGEPLWIAGSHYPLTPCRVNEGAWSTWFIDTAMSGVDLACSPSAARRHGAEPAFGEELAIGDDAAALATNLVHLRRFQHANLTFPTLPAAVLPDFKLGRELGIRIGGIIGHDWLSRHRMQLDYRAMLVRISALDSVGGDHEGRGP
jgi:hypothetical protein